MTASKKTQILIVEDDQTLCEMYATKFSMEGFDVTKAHDGQEGLAQAQALKPDVVLLDIIMPKLDGFSVLTELRKDPRLQDAVVVMLTNLGQDDDIKKGEQLGADDYFVKSNHTPADIVSKVQAHLKRKG